MSRTTRLLRTRIAAGALGALALTGATLVATPEAGLTSGAFAAEPEFPANCEEDESSSEFGGAKISQTYSDLFSKGAPAARYLDSYTPQGLGLWENWQGGSGTEDLLLVGMHYFNDPATSEDDEESHRSRLYGMTTSGAVRGFATLPIGAHTGGVKVHDGWVYVQKSQTEILRYSVERVRQAFTDPSKRKLGPGRDTAPVEGASFFDIDDGYLYAGRHDENVRGEMRRYTIKANGDLALDESWGPLEIPTKAQGVLVLDDTFVFSTSLGRGNRGNVYVVQRSYGVGEEFTQAPYRCFQSVAMIQELVSWNGVTYLLNESGSAEFADGRIHNIRNLHVASTARLRSLVW
ncbi:hypothetical protein LL946_05680 [Knoellia locipacati]|uniref:hypothetical protein n=1 Tax=Knoellia locipacati TaxID=882824 RepID=UPI00384D4F67